MPGIRSDFGVVQESFSQLSTRADMDQTSNPSTSPTDETRGRRRNREGQNGDESDNTGDQENGNATGNSKKRRRSRKGLDKKFECPHDGCGKSYSRAEHLYRHQLNRRFTHLHDWTLLDLGCASAFIMYSVPHL